MRAAMVALLLTAYLSTLAVSAGHLARWYALSLGDLPPWLAWGLAGSLEFTAFLLSLLSNSLLRGSAWAAGGAVGALGLVWLGNALSMQRAAPGLPLWEVLAGSLFVPVGTYVTGKVVGELLRASRVDRGVPEAVPGVDRVAPQAAQEVDRGVPHPVPRVDRAAPRAVPEVDRGADRVVPQVVQEVDRAVPEADRGMGQVVPQVDRGADLPGPERTTLRYRERTLDLEVEGRGADLVHVLHLRGPMSLNALVRELGWPKTSVRRWLDRLEAQGLVHRTGDGWEVVRGA